MSSCLLSEKQANRNVNYLAALDFIISLGFGLIMPLFPNYVKLLGGEGDPNVGLEVGILFSSFVLTRALLAAPFGNLSDRVGRKKLILIGSFLYAFLAVLFTVPESWTGLIFVRGLQGVASAMVWPVSEALVIDSCPPDRRGASLGKVVMSANLGMVVGPFIGGALYFAADEMLGMSEIDSFKFPFYFTALVALVGAILAWIYVTDARSPAKQETRMTFKELLRPEGMTKQGLTNLRVLYANAAMEGFSFSSIGPLMVLFLSFVYALGADAISIVIGSAMGVGALIAFPAGRLADRTSKKMLFVIGGYIAFVGTILIPFAWALAAAVAFLAMRALAFQVASPALRALQADTVPENVRGRLIGMLESMSNLGSVIGAPLGGFLWDTFHDMGSGTVFSIDGTVVPFMVSGLLGLYTVTLVLLFVKEQRRSPSSG